jgi:RNA polymerase sigma factor (sigma-70 family)
MGEESDAQVISDSLTDPERFGVLFDRHATVLFRYFVRRVGVHEADGLVADVFRVAFEKRGTYDLDRPNARPWLYGIGTRLLAHHRRGEARRLNATARLLAQREERREAIDDVAAAVDASRAWAATAEAIGALPDIERDALLLFVWEELSYDDIAEALGIPVGTVRSRLNRARGRLRDES